jgi:hypothetical protein
VAVASQQADLQQQQNRLLPALQQNFLVAVVVVFLQVEFPVGINGKPSSSPAYPAVNRHQQPSFQTGMMALLVYARY